MYLWFVLKFWFSQQIKGIEITLIQCYFFIRDVEIMLYQRYFNPILQWVVASLQTMKNTYGGIFIFNKVIKNDTSPKLFLIFCLEANSGKSQNAPLHILILNKVVNAGFTTCMFVLCIHLAKKHFFPVDKKIFLCIVTHLHATFSWPRSTYQTYGHKWVSRCTYSTLPFVNCTIF